MPTQTQKNFRKQMEKIQKELESSNQAPVYSYIENDHIENYYKKKPISRKKIGISLGSIITVVFIIYSIYTWIKPLAPQQNRQIYKDTSVSLQQIDSLSPDLYDNSRQGKIFNYLKMTDEGVKIINEIYDYYNNNYYTALNNSDFKETFIQMMDRGLSQFDEIFNRISSLDCPDDLKDYHNCYLETRALQIKCIKNDLSQIKNPGKQVPNNSKDAERINFLCKQESQYLLKCFSDAGIKFEVQADGSVRYWYQK